MRLCIVVFALCLCALPVIGDEKPARKSADKLLAIKELPSPFLFLDGKPVRTADDWKRRREELKTLFQDYQYGTMPPKPKMTVTKGKVIEDETNKVKLQDLVLKLEHDGKSLDVHVRLAWPSDARKAVPVVIQSSFFGRSKGTSGKAFAQFTKRGYGVAECTFNEFASDGKNARSGGVYKLFGEKHDCGGLMAWAWGVSRTIDALDGMDTFDAKRVVVTGHSRYGKAALVAGAFDDRIALTVPSHSGCAGAAPYRLIYGKAEQLHNIAGAFPHWFRPDFKEFVGKVDHLPVDQHLLMALVAPRGLLQTEGLKDTWTNPEGAQQAHAAAKKVYDFLKVGDRISVRYRDVGHIPNNGDLMDFADKLFFDKKLSDEFGKLPYKADKKAFSWDAPK